MFTMSSESILSDNKQSSKQRQDLEYEELNLLSTEGNFNQEFVKMISRISRFQWIFYHLKSVINKKKKRKGKEITISN